MDLRTRLRQLIGVAVLDWPHYQKVLREPTSAGQATAPGWVALHNRIEQISMNPHGPGVRCDWQWGSELHACTVWPALGRQLMRKALHDWPIEFADIPPRSSGPRVSFIFAHGGRSRLPQLQRTIRSVFAQQDIDIECVVIDQSPVSLMGELPAQVVYRHLSKDGVPSGWHKSWACNVGARLASGEILVFQDGDICVPQRYGAEVVRTILKDGYDAASLQRFLFYLDPEATRQVEAVDRLDVRRNLQQVFQNWKGGTIAVRREAFLSLGGFDEGFVDWGGEDDEFFDRCNAVRHCRFGFLPFVHLWHPPQPDRKVSDNPNIAQIMPLRMQVPVSDRIAELTARRFGNPLHPDPAASYKSGIAG
jgi:glycosyl transferase family 7 (putative galactosyltransferase)